MNRRCKQKISKRPGFPSLRYSCRVSVYQDGFPASAYMPAGMAPPAMEFPSITRFPFLLSLPPRERRESDDYDDSEEGADSSLPRVHVTLEDLCTSWTSTSRRKTRSRYKTDGLRRRVVSSSESLSGYRRRRNREIAVRHAKGHGSSIRMGELDRAIGGPIEIAPHWVACVHCDRHEVPGFR